MARIYDIPTKYVNITEKQFTKLLKQIEERQYTADELEIRTELNDKFYENNLYDRRVILLTQALKQNPHIQKLSLIVQSISDDGAKALSEIEHLTDIDVGYNFIRMGGAVALLNANLTRLSIEQNNDLDSASSMESVSAMHEALAENQTLTELILNWTWLGNNTVAQILANNTSIKKLHLVHNHAYIEGLRPIADNNTLQYLDLSECKLTDHAAEIISKNASLLTLIVNISNITNKGGAFLSTHPTLRTLYIKDSEMTAPGLECFLHSNLRKVVPDNETKTKISEFEICEFERAFRYIREEKEYLLTNSIYEQAVDLGGDVNAGDTGAE